MRGWAESLSGGTWPCIPVRTADKFTAGVGVGSLCLRAARYRA